MIEDLLIPHRNELTAIRHDLHMHPEMLFEEVRTAPSWRASLQGLASRLRRDLPRPAWSEPSATAAAAGPSASAPTWTRCRYTRPTNLPYASKYPGKMHACGHDGHTTMLLGLARYLAESRNFDGTVHLIFQPSEEDEGGALRMIEDGLFKRFPCDAVFALHNIPGEEPGQVIVRPGPITAAVDIVGITVRGLGGHGAVPQKAIDPIVAASSLVIALQSVYRATSIRWILLSSRWDPSTLAPWRPSFPERRNSWSV